MSAAAFVLCFLVADVQLTPEQKEELTERTWMWTGVLVVVLLLGAVLFSWIEKWRKRQMADERPGGELTSYRSLYESGELSKEEYDRVRSRVARQTHEKMVPKKPAPPAPPAPPASADPGATGLTE